MIEKGCRIRGTKIEIPLDADASEKVDGVFLFRRVFYYLKIADKTLSDVVLCFMNFYFAARASECNRC